MHFFNASESRTSNDLMREQNESCCFVNKIFHICEYIILIGEILLNANHITINLVKIKIKI